MDHFAGILVFEKCAPVFAWHPAICTDIFMGAAFIIAFDDVVMPALSRYIKQGCLTFYHQHICDVLF